MTANSTPLILHIVRSALLGLAGLTASFALLSDEAWAQEVGAVTKIRADAYGTPPDGKRARKFARYDVVFGELIETSGNAAILIKMNDETELFMGERASLTIDEFVYDPGSQTGRAVFNFAVGTLRFVSGSMDSTKITILTPNANIGMRGSEAIIFVTVEGQTIVNVTKGTFLVRGRERMDRPPVIVKANQNVSLSGAATFSAIGVGTLMPTYGHAPGANDLDGDTFDTDKGDTGPDHSEDLKDIKGGGGFDKAKPGKVKGSRGGDGHGHHDDGHNGH